MVNVLIFILLVSTLAKSSANMREKRIVHGNEAEPEQATYTVALMVLEEVLCSGSIIGNQFVLTAAHCVSKDDEVFEDVELICVVIDAQDLTKRTRENMYYIDKAYVSKMFESKHILEDNPNKFRYADIAVLKLKTKINFNSNSPIQRLDLPLPDVMIGSLLGQDATICGFGINELKVEKDPETGRLIKHSEVYYQRLHYAETTILSSLRCSLTGPLRVSYICAQIKQNCERNPRGVCDVCMGDSGGPLVYKGRVVIGVLSTSPDGCNEFDIPAVYTDVWFHLKFIRNAMADRVTPDMRVYVSPF